MYLETVNENI